MDPVLVSRIRALSDGMPVCCLNACHCWLRRGAHRQGRWLTDTFLSCLVPSHNLCQVTSLDRKYMNIRKLYFSSLNGTMLKFSVVDRFISGCYPFLSPCSPFSPFFRRWPCITPFIVFRPTSSFCFFCPSFTSLVSCKWAVLKASSIHISPSRGLQEGAQGKGSQAVDSGEHDLGDSGTVAPQEA